MAHRQHPVRRLAEDEKPREKLRNLGPEALADDELLAVILASGSRGAVENSADHVRSVPVGAIFASPIVTCGAAPRGTLNVSDIAAECLGPRSSRSSTRISRRRVAASDECCCSSASN